MLGTELFRLELFDNFTIQPYSVMLGKGLFRLELFDNFTIQL